MYIYVANMDIYIAIPTLSSLRHFHHHPLHLMAFSEILIM